MCAIPTDSGIINVHEVPEDTVLPQLPVVFDSARMQRIFQVRLFDTPDLRDRYRILACDILRLRYKREKKCMVCYRLSIRDRQSQLDSEQILCARVFEPEASSGHFDRAKSRRLIEPKFGPPLIHIEELEMVAWAFPNDPKLHTLADFMNAGRLRDKTILPVIIAHFGPGWGLESMKNEIVHYVAEHTCTQRVEVHLRHWFTRITQKVIFYGKTYYNEEGAKTYRIMRELWQSAARQQGRLVIAKPLRYDPELKIVWQMGLQGSTLLEHDLHNYEILGVINEMASSIAHLHKTTLTDSTPGTCANWVTKLDEVKAILLSVRPECRKALVPLVDRLVSGSAQINSQHTATLHGDLHINNFILESDAVALIDLDNICIGPPLQDIGSFIASLYYRGILRGIDQPVIDKIAQRLLRSYSSLVPWPVPQEELSWYLATALIVERAFRSVTRLKSGSLDIIDDLIELADEVSLNLKNIDGDSVPRLSVAGR